MRHEGNQTKLVQNSLTRYGHMGVRQRGGWVGGTGGFVSLTFRAQVFFFFHTCCDQMRTILTCSISATYPPKSGYVSF
jgi:hypothetical protein